MILRLMHFIVCAMAVIYLSIRLVSVFFGESVYYTVQAGIDRPWPESLFLFVESKPIPFTGYQSRPGGYLMKSYIAKPQEVERKWYVLDAEGKTLGRLASEAASILRGKKKPIYTPHVDTGDYVIIINAEKVEVTGKKRKEKIYKRHTGYPGGLREITFEKLQAKNPEEIIRHAVKGMMPKGPLGRQMYKKLKVYAGAEHNHAAQKPEVWEF
jgi:large subunit ribosomal protein L13